MRGVRARKSSIAAVVADAVAVGIDEAGAAVGAVAAVRGVRARDSGVAAVVTDAVAVDVNEAGTAVGAVATVTVVVMNGDVKAAAAVTVSVVIDIGEAGGTGGPGAAVDGCVDRDVGVCRHLSGGRRGTDTHEQSQCQCGYA